MDFIRKERRYIVMAFFILLITALNLGHGQKRHVDEKGVLSAKTIGELGITEDKIKAFFESDRPLARVFKYGFMAVMSAFLLGILLNLRVIVRKGDAIFKIDPGRAPVAWSIYDILKVVIIIVFSGYALNAFEHFTLKPFNVSLDSNLLVIVNTFLIDAIAVLVILYFVMVKYGKGVDSLGLKSAGIHKNILVGIAAYAFILPTLLAILILSMLLMDFLGYKPPPQPVFDLFLEEKRSNVILFLTIFVSVLGPMIEEIFFRGFLYGAVKKRFGIAAGVILSAALFSALHTNIIGFLPIMALGVLMAYLYETTGSLVASITVHVLHNSLIVSFVFLIKELIK